MTAPSRDQTFYDSRVCVGCGKSLKDYPKRYRRRCEAEACRVIYRAKNYATNRDREVAGMQRWHAEHRDHKKEYSAEWRKANREWFSEYRRANRGARIAYNRQWYEANLDKASTQRQRRRARLKGAKVGEVTLKDWRRLVDRFRGCCAYCQATNPRPHMDHVIPLVRGGTHSIGNVLPACPTCNLKKGTRLLVEWRSGRQMQRNPRGA